MTPRVTPWVVLQVAVVRMKESGQIYAMKIMNKWDMLRRGEVRGHGGDMEGHTGVAGGTWGMWGGGTGTWGCVEWGHRGRGTRESWGPRGDVE